MGRILKVIVAALPLVILGAVLATELPEMRRYIKMKRM